jgi:endonuclease YncB( thermonuclease family)
MLGCGNVVRFGWALGLAVALLPCSGSAEEVRGQATVVDGDSLEIHGRRVRLHGIDAPEAGQRCTDTHGAAYNCGQRAALALDDKIGRQVTTCIGESSDVYGRLVAVCRAGGEDLGQWMVRRGWARAYLKYSTAYAGVEALARSEELGIWAGESEPPWEWRRRASRRSRPAEDGDRACAIKGNISHRSGERIYHVPGGKWYEGTTINESRGERWFCTEAEARAAGWRASRE